MTNVAVNAQGVTIEVDSSTPGTPDTQVENVKSFSGFDGEASEIDTTHLLSTAKEYQLGLQDFGSMTLDFNASVLVATAGQKILRDAASDGSIKTFKFTFDDNSTASFSAYVKNADRLAGAVDGILEGGASLRITGAVTYADA